jgi:integron integrase
MEASMSTPRLMDQVRHALRVHHYSLRTEQAYIQWIRRYIFFHNKRHPREMGADEIASFLSHLAVNKHVSASTQNQALSALLFLYKKVLNVEPDWVENVVRAKRAKRLPVVLSRETVTRLLSQIDDPYRLICWLMYGTGLHLYEALTLRVKDIDFDQNQIIVRAGKGNKDRVTVLPLRLVEPLQEQLNKSRVFYEKDRHNAAPGVYLPYALERKYPRAGMEWPWHPVKGLHEILLRLCSKQYNGGVLVYWLY